jgi:hypothetical protein
MSAMVSATAASSQYQPPVARIIAPAAATPAAAQRPLFGNAVRLPRPGLRETQAGSGAGGHEGGEDVVRVAVQVLAGP